MAAQRRGGDGGVARALRAGETGRSGTYYWVASYSGDTVNAPSASPCGSEVLIVSTKKNLNLPSSKGCASKRKFVVHPERPGATS